MKMLKWWKQDLTVGAIDGGVRRALHGDPRLRDFDAPRIRINVSERGEVLLDGAVSTPEARQLAERLVRDVKGVSGVRNELRTDAELTKQLRAALAQDARTVGLEKHSVVFHGMAELRGSASYDAQLAAIKMAAAIQGVRGVSNNAQVASAVASTPVPTAA